MQSCDVYAATRLAEASWRRDNFILNFSILFSSSQLGEARTNQIKYDIQPE